MNGPFLGSSVAGSGSRWEGRWEMGNGRWEIGGREGLVGGGIEVSDVGQRHDSCRGYEREWSYYLTRVFV